MLNTGIWYNNGQLVPLDSINYDGDNVKDVAVCIVNRDRPDITDSLVENIHKHKGDLSVDIYVIEMGSKDKSKNMSFYYDDPNFRGKAYGHNVSVRYAKARGKYRYYFTVMNDVYFTTPERGLEKLVAIADANPSIGILSPTEPDSGYAGGICKPIKGRDFHCVSQCNYLALLVRGECLDKVGYLTPEFKYCWGAIHELSYKMYSNEYKVAYCDAVQMYHMGSSTYGKVKSAVSREEYLKNAQMFAARYMVEHYGKKWDKLFSSVLTDDVMFNTYTKHRDKWEKSIPKAERALYRPINDDTSLEARIKNLDPWYYPVVVGGIEVTPGIGSKQSPESLIKRTKFRHELLVDKIVQKYDFNNKSVLDVAANCAYWSSHYALNGATKMTALEGRKIYVDQGELYWDNNNFMEKDAYKFIHCNVMDSVLWDGFEDNQFDFTLCAGILYHINDYEWLLSNIARVTREVVLVDTRVGSDSEVQEGGGWCFDAIVETSLKKIPSLESIELQLNGMGFKTEQITTSTEVPKEMVSHDNYNTGRRVTILASRR